MDSVSCDFDRFLEARQLGDMWERCKRRATCTLDWRGRPLKPSAAPAATPAVTARADRTDSAKPPTHTQLLAANGIYERGFAECLIKFPAAFHAILRYVREMFGISDDDPAIHALLAEMSRQPAGSG